MTPPSDPPLCECHGLPMRWRKSVSCNGGSWWDCSQRPPEVVPMIRELCKCHGLPMRWSKTSEMSGGYWRCAERIRERDREDKRERYATDPEWAELQRERQRVRRTDPEWADLRRSRRRAEYHSDPEMAERIRERQRERRRLQPGYDHRNRITVWVGGNRFSYRVPPEKKDEIKAQLAEYRAAQANDYRRAANDGWIDTAV